MREPSVGLDEPIPPPKSNVAQSKSNVTSESHSSQILIKPRSGAFSITLFFLFAFFVTTICGFMGFYFGDSFGREHAQYNNPVLREHYTGQCVQHLGHELRKEIRSAMGRNPEEVRTAGHSVEKELIAIRANLESIKEAFMNAQSHGGLPSNTNARLRKMLDLLENRHVELVSDRCPASPTLPRKYSSQG